MIFMFIIFVASAIFLHNYDKQYKSKVKMVLSCKDEKELAKLKRMVGRGDR